MTADHRGNSRHPVIDPVDESDDHQTHLQLALVAAQLATWQWDPITDVLTKSHNLPQLYGCTHDNALHCRADSLALIHAEDLHRHQSLVMNTVEHGGAYTSQFRITRPDNGQTVWLEERGHAQGDVSGSTRLVGVVMDITDSMQASEALRQRAEELQTLLDTLPIGVFIAHDPDSRVITGNRAAYEMLRNPATRNLSLTAPDDERPDNFRVLQNGIELQPEQLPVQLAARGQTIRDAELDVVFDDGNAIHELVSASPLYDSHGRVRGAVASVLDATDQKRSQEWLAGQKNILELVAKDTSLVEVLRVLCELIEAREPSVRCSLLVTEPQNNIIGFAVAPSFAPDFMRQFLGLKVQPPYPGPCFQAMATNEVVTVLDLATDERFDANGRIALAELGFRACKSYPVRTTDTISRASLCLYSAERGEPRLSNEGWIQAVLQLIEISIQRHSTQEALKHSESLFRTLGEALPDMLWIADAAGRPIYQNPAWRTFTGMSQADLMRDGWEHMAHPDDLPRMHALWQQASETLEPFAVEYRCRRHDGVYRWCFAKTVALKDEAGRLVQWIGTTTDIHDRKFAEDALRESDRKKDEFLATLAHELRNPLAPIQNGLQIIKLVPNDTAMIAQAREMMERQLSQLIRLIDDLMDLTRISRGKINLRKTRLDIAQPIRSAIETSRSLIETAGHSLHVHLPGEPAFLMADEIRIAQVITNLLNNAAKYTPQGGHINLSVEVQADEVSIAVQDNGVGIPVEMLPRVFDMFTQVDSSLEKAQGGLGIGLSIVKKLVEMHDGRAEAFSDGVGLGSRFVVTLPQDKSMISPQSVNVCPSPAVVPLSLKVLVVDDNRDSALSIAALLKMLGHRTEVVHDGLAAVASAASFRPDIVLLDIGLPLLNGYDVCRRIRAEPWGAEMLIVACTGWGQEEDKRTARAAGCNVHVTKPIELAALKQILAEKGSGLNSVTRKCSANET